MSATAAAMSTEKYDGQLHAKEAVEISSPADDSSDVHNAKDDAKTRTLGRLNLVTKRDIDDSTVWYNQHKDSVEPLTPEEQKRLTRKNFWFLLCQTWWIAFLIHLDKSTLSQASVMGLFKDVKDLKDQYNHLFVLFYSGYLIALWPGAIISQRVGHKQFITGSLLLWALLLGMHPLVKTAKQMMALRFLLGMVCAFQMPKNTNHPN